LSYAALDRESDDVAWGLTAAGVKEGSVVGLRLSSGFDYVIAYAAAAKAGAATAGVNPSLAPVEQDAIIERLAPDLVLDGELPRGNAGAAPSAPVLGDNPERLAAIVFTSGTTGPPKGAMF